MEGTVKEDVVSTSRSKPPRNDQEMFRLLGKGEECPSKLLINVFSVHSYFMTCLENGIDIINWTVSC